MKFWLVVFASLLTITHIMTTEGYSSIDAIGPMPTSVTRKETEGISKSFYGVHIHRADNGTKWPEIRFGSWRLWDTYVTWPDLEPSPGVWDFAKLDKYVELAAKAQIDVVLPLGMTPQWASLRPNEYSAYGPGKASEPFDMNEWREYVLKVARRFKGRIKFFELWNEINLKQFYTGSFETMVKLQKITYETLKEVDRSNKLISPSFTGNSMSEVKKFGAYLRSGGFRYADIISYHLYTPTTHPEALLPLIAAINKEIKDSGVENKPLWNTESGYVLLRPDDKEVDEQINARWLRLSEKESTAYLIISWILQSQMGLERSFYYAWDNKIYGVVDGKKKNMPETKRSIGWFIDWSIGKTPVGCHLEQILTRCSYVDAITGVQSEIVWANHTSKVGLFKSKKGKTRDLCDGKDTEIGSNDQGRSVQVGICPILVTYR